MKVVIIGAVAAGASAAARLRRLDESAEIILLDRGPYMSYANCGLPYHIGGAIPDRDSLLVMPSEKFRSWFNIDVRLQNEVVQIDRQTKTVTVRRRQTAGQGGPSDSAQTNNKPAEYPAGQTTEQTGYTEQTNYTESYDKLLIATGSSPLKIQVNLPGGDDSRIVSLWTIADMDKILGQIQTGVRQAVVVGGGFIGLETAENLAQRGIKTTIVEMAPQVLPPMDQEMTVPVERELIQNGIELKLGRKTVAFEKSDSGALFVVLDDGSKLSADLVIMSAGVKPNSELAKSAGLELGPRGHIVVNSRLQTSDPDIFAAGDVTEVRDPITGAQTAIALAGPANKQGRIAADNIAQRDSIYPGSYGTSIVKIGDLSAAVVGYSQRRLELSKIPYERIYLHPASNASYYPGSSLLDMKLLFDSTGRILGAQIVGRTGVDKRIDVIAAAMEAGQSVYELAKLELAYAPPFNSAKDPVNFAGMIASNVLNGDSRPVQADQIPASALVLDVRTELEFELGAIPGAKNIPLEELRSRLGELPTNQPIVATCRVGLRGYLAERILRQNGFDAYNLSGGYSTWLAFHPDKLPAAQPPAVSKPARVSADVPASASVSKEAPTEPSVVLDVRALPCPGPVIKIKQTIDSLPSGATARILASAGFLPDLKNWSAASGNPILTLEVSGAELSATIQKGNQTAANPQSRDSASVAPGNDACSCSACAIQTANQTVNQSQDSSGAIVLFSNDLDKAMAAFIIATGMAASGMKVAIFFTFWGLSVLRKNPAPQRKKTIMERMFGFMLPRGAANLSLSKMNMGGMGTVMMNQVMKQKNVASLPTLIEQARSLGVRFIACEMAMGVMGLEREDLIDVDEVAGVASFVQLAKNSNSTLFI